MTVFGLACSEFFCFNFLFWYFLTPDDLLKNFLVLHNFFQIKNVIAQFPWFCNYSILFHLQNFENFLFPKCLKQKSSWNISDWFLNLCHYLFFCKITAKQFYNIWQKGGSPGLVVMERDSFPKVVSSNPGTVYWMDIFHIRICCKKCNVCLNRQK